MPHSYGRNAHTRSTFSRDFKTHGYIRTSTYLQTYRVGDYVDIIGNGAVQMGMPHRYYHGKTGRVWNVTPRAVGVEIGKKVGNRIIKKRIHVRIEHVQKSRCRDSFLSRVASNDKKKRDAKVRKEVISTKRAPPGQPKPGEIIDATGQTVQTVTPIPYEFVV